MEYSPEITRQLAELLKQGASVSLPNQIDQKTGNFVWTIENQTTTHE